VHPAGRKQQAAGDEPGSQQRDETLHCWRSSVGFAVFALRSATSALYSSSFR
jgi:hypothetical protein